MFEPLTGAQSERARRDIEKNVIARGIGGGSPRHTGVGVGQNDFRLGNYGATRIADDSGDTGARCLAVCRYRQQQPENRQNVGGHYLLRCAVKLRSGLLVMNVLPRLSAWIQFW